MTMTDDGPHVGDVVLLKGEPDYFAVVDEHPEGGWRLVRIVRASKLGRYRARYPGPTVPLVHGHLPPSSFVRQTKDLRPDEADQFLDVAGAVHPSDLRRAQELIR